MGGAVTPRDGCKPLFGLDLGDPGRVSPISLVLDWNNRTEKLKMRGLRQHEIEPQGVCIMPKMKTHKGTKKRFRLSGKGKAMHRQSGTSHLAARMSQKRKRNLRGTAPVDKTMESSIQRALCGNSY